MRIRASVAAFLAATIIALAAPTTAEALPRGIYVIHCHKGIGIIHNIEGTFYGLLGLCGSFDYTIRIVVRGRVVSPPPPILDPPEDEVWQGASASDWVAYIRDGTIPGEGEDVDPTELEGDFPTLTCNEADFDPPEG